MDMNILHIIALKDNKIYDLQKENEQLRKDKRHFMELYLKECKSNEQNLMAYLGSK